MLIKITILLFLLILLAVVRARAREREINRRIASELNRTKVWNKDREI